MKLILEKSGNFVKNIPKFGNFTKIAKQTISKEASGEGNEAKFKKKKRD